MYPSIRKKMLFFVLSVLLSGIVIGYKPLSLDQDSFFIEENMEYHYNVVDKQTFGIIFFKILLNNFLVAFFISLMGFATGGILTILILFFNGLQFGSMLYILINLPIETSKKVYLLIFHGPIELLAFVIFAMLGMKGFSFYKQILSEVKADNLRKYLPDLYEYILPSIILLLAASIETIVITYSL